MEILRPLDLADVLSNRSPYLHDPTAHLTPGLEPLQRLPGSERGGRQILSRLLELLYSGNSAPGPGLVPRGQAQLYNPNPNGPGVIERDIAGSFLLREQKVSFSQSLSV